MIDGRPGDVRGFIHKRIGGALKGAIGGVLSGNPLSAIGGAFGGFARGGAPPPVSSSSSSLGRFIGQTITSFAPPQATPVTPVPGLGGFISRILPGGSTGFEVGPQTQQVGQGVAVQANIGNVGGATGMLAGPGGCKALVPCGFHAAKTTYVRKIDRCGPYDHSNLEIVPAGTFIQGKRRKRFNNANGAAQARSIARLEAGTTQAIKLLKAVGYKKISKTS